MNMWRKQPCPASPPGQGITLLMLLKFGADWCFPRARCHGSAYVGRHLSEDPEGCNSRRTSLGPLLVVLLRLQV